MVESRLHPSLLPSGTISANPGRGLVVTSSGAWLRVIGVNTIACSTLPLGTPARIAHAMS